MEARMLTAIAIAAAVGLAVGLAGPPVVRSLQRPEPVAPAIAEVATVVEAVEAEDVADAETRSAAAVGALDATQLLVGALVAQCETAPSAACQRLLGALTDRALCLAAIQGGAVQSSGANCEEAQDEVARALAGLVEVAATPAP